MLIQENFDFIIAILAFITLIILIAVVFQRSKFINWSFVLIFGTIGGIFYYFSNFNTIFRPIADLIYLIAFIGLFAVTISDYNQFVIQKQFDKLILKQIILYLTISIVIFIPINFLILLGVNDFLVEFILLFMLELVLISNLLYVYILIKAFSITKLFFQLSIFSVFVGNAATILSFYGPAILWDLSYVFNILTYSLFISCGLTVYFEDQLYRVTTDLDETERILKSFLEFSPLGVLLFQDNKIILVNSSFANISGFSKSELLNWTIDDILTPFPEADREKMISLMAKTENINNKDSEENISTKVRNKFGIWKWVEFYLKTIMYKGKLANFVIMIDVTERTELEERFKVAFLNSPHAIVLVDSETRKFILFNDKFVELFGYGTEELIKINFEDLSIPDDFKLQMDEYPFSKIYQDGFKVKTNKKYKKKDGTIFEAFVTSSYIKISDDKGYAITQIMDISFIKDIQHYKDLINSLEQTNNELIMINQVVSHDIKAPLIAIENLLSLVETDYHDQLSNEILAVFKQITTKVQFTSNLVKEILDYSGIGFFENEVETVNPKKLIEDILNVLTIPKSISLDIQESLPIIKMPKIRVQQIFQNLISNAIKFNDKEKGLIKIGAKELTTNEYEFFVEDNGVGIPKEAISLLFTPFKTLNKSPQSTGLGLAIVKKIVQHYEGTVKIDSDLGVRTVISFTLPAKYVIL